MWNIYKLTNLFYLLFSSYIWWSFSFPTNIVVAGVSIIMIALLLLSRIHLTIDRKAKISFVLLIVIGVWSAISTTQISYGLINFFSYLPATLLLCLPVNRKYNLLQFVTKWYGLIMLGSIIILLLVNIIGLPSGGQFLAGELPYPPYDNYYLWIRNTGHIGDDILRFNGPFLEPGHQAMISTFLLFANGYEFKTKPILWVLLVCVLLSFSLAGYVLVALGFLILKMKSMTKALGIAVAFIGVFYFITDFWNGGNNPVNEKILARMEFDSEKGLKGNNRTTKATDDYFEQILKTDIFWYGIRNEQVTETQIVGAGYKIYILRYGMISVMLVLLYYWNQIPIHPNKRMAYGFLILVVAAFMQRAYPGWYSWLLPYTLGVQGVGLMKLNKIETGRSFTSGRGKMRLLGK